MPKARKNQISLEVTPYYHCTSRCVRRAFLCGEDASTGISYEHRRQWVEDRLLELAQTFAIDICAYAVMNNHLHVVLHINKKLCNRLSDRDVCERWHKLYKGTFLTHKFLNRTPLSKAETKALELKLDQWRSQLTDISWFMRALNEPIARRANAEDECTGRFWEGRFSSQALLDEKALIACMAYVDLNPIRAKIAKSLNDSHHTTVFKRIKKLQNGHTLESCFMPFKDEQPQAPRAFIPIDFSDYLELLESTAMSAGKNATNKTFSSYKILNDIGLAHEKWMTLATRFEEHTKNLVGEPEQTRVAARKMGYKRTPGLGLSCQFF
jgi:REP element-mobilizing transposase RayT